MTNEIQFLLQKGMWPRKVNFTIKQHTPSKTSRAVYLGDHAVIVIVLINPIVIVVFIITMDST